jgi:large subunit ribosomal protein L6
MSRIGRKPLLLPKGVTLSQKAGQFSVKGPKGELAKILPEGISIKLEGNKLVVSRAPDSRVNHPPETRQA